MRKMKALNISAAASFTFHGRASLSARGPDTNADPGMRDLKTRGTSEPEFSSFKMPRIQSFSAAAGAGGISPRDIVRLPDSRRSNSSSKKQKHSGLRNQALLFDPKRRSEIPSIFAS